MSSGVEQAMAVGASRYADALAELSRFGPAEFTQTGGMCAALELTLERGYLLITDAEDSLPWDRGDLAGWGVGFYASHDYSEGPEVFVSAESDELASLSAAVQECLQQAAIALRAHVGVQAGR